ncbi:MAG: efflux RND transporter permease subunit, partial [Pseudomonadota bacterium]
VAGVVAVRSSSEEGNFRMSVEFRPSRNLADASNDVREAVSRVTQRLPDGVEDLFVVKSERDANSIIDIAVWSDTDPIDVVTRRVEDEIIPELTAVDGVAEIVVFGDRERVIRVEVSPERLAAYGLSIAEVSGVLEAAQFDVPVGAFDAGQLEVLVRADATVTDPERIEELMIRDPVRLGDIAEVYSGLATPESVARLDGRLVLSLGVVRQAQSNTVAISDQTQAAVSRLQSRFPDLNFKMISDDAVFIRSSIKEVLTTLVAALLIVVGVIWLFFGRLGATMAPAVAIPIALIGSVAAIWALGFSINLITLLALVLATGLVVDDAIVVTENIQKRRAEGMGAKAAAVIGAREVFFAVIATTLTLIAVFVPISFLPSDAGRLFTEFGFVLAITVALSSFVALSICPAIAAQLPPPGKGLGIGAWIGRKVSGAYTAALKPLLAAPLIALTVATLIAATALPVYQQLGEELVPAEDRGMVTVWMQGPDGTGLDYTDRQVEQVEAMLDPWVETGDVQGVYSITGRYDLNRGYVRARLAPWEARETTQAQIQNAVRGPLGDLAGARGIVWPGNSLALRRGSNGGLSIALIGPEYPEIAAAAFDFAAKMEEELTDLSRIRVQYQATQPQLSIRMDRARAADL